MPERMPWSEVKRRWALMTDDEQEAVKAKQQWEHMSRLGVAHDWPSMFPNRTAAWQPDAVATTREQA